MNENGQRLLEFCSRDLLFFTNTFIKGKFMRKVSWKHPCSGHWHQLDLVLTRRKNLYDVLHTRTFHSADCDTDHSLIITVVSFSPKKIHSARTVRGKKLKAQYNPAPLRGTLLVFIPALYTTTLKELNGTVIKMHCAVWWKSSTPSLGSSILNRSKFIQKVKIQAVMAWATSTSWSSEN